MCRSVQVKQLQSKVSRWCIYVPLVALASLWVVSPFTSFYIAEYFPSDRKQADFICVNTSRRKSHWDGCVRHWSAAWHAQEANTHTLEKLGLLAQNVLSFLVIHSVVICLHGWPFLKKFFDGRCAKQWITSKWTCWNFNHKLLYKGT